MSKIPILHSKIKHNEIRNHFIKEHVLNGDAFFEYMCTENQLADIFTKPLSEEKFFHIRRELGIFDPFAWMAIYWGMLRKGSDSAGVDLNIWSSRLLLKSTPADLHESTWGQGRDLKKR